MVWGNLISLIDFRINKFISKIYSILLRNKKAIVTAYNEKAYECYVYFPDDKNKQIYCYYNKSGERLKENDVVYITYTTNLSRGWISERAGVPNINTRTDNGNKIVVEKPSKYYELFLGSAVNAGIADGAYDGKGQEQGEVDTYISCNAVLTEGYYVAQGIKFDIGVQTAYKCWSCGSTMNKNSNICPNCNAVHPDSLIMRDIDYATYAGASLYCYNEDYSIDQISIRTAVVGDSKTEGEYMYGIFIGDNQRQSFDGAIYRFGGFRFIFDNIEIVDKEKCYINATAVYAYLIHKSTSNETYYNLSLNKKVVAEHPYAEPLSPGGYSVSISVIECNDD